MIITAQNRDIIYSFNSYIYIDEVSKDIKIKDKTHDNVVIATYDDKAYAEVLYNLLYSKLLKHEEFFTFPKDVQCFKVGDLVSNSDYSEQFIILSIINNKARIFIDDVYIVVKESDIERLKVNPKTYTNLYDEYVRYCEYMQFGHCNKKVFKEILLNNPDIIYKERTKNARNVVLNLQLNPDIEHDLAKLLIEKY